MNKKELTKLFKVFCEEQFIDYSIDKTAYILNDTYYTNFKTYYAISFKYINCTTGYILIFEANYSISDSFYNFYIKNYFA